ncbi:A/G-specific adenine glycosylase [Natronoglycomyces albus]|uniref:Adenine DNA glycosylase n=1 Tax=Natronoglycomyces albus TaxID=2811108 RepID=A0A895XQ63_9ACTN|nr:A/G-specific adenine glycosylase [Natronoglycomyces albus]QSB05265.1 A/G-specific adenine glycosylase [Natronoglycomyces albus]
MDSVAPDWLAKALIPWFEQNQRSELPWRQPGTTAWGVLVSEVMSQQTPVARVAPAWEAWMAAWPTPADLASAATGDVLRAWGSLGYPRRALRLQACAERIAEHHGNVVPRQLDQLLELPGIGTYTAAAVAVFAYRQRHPVVDTNVRRVVARLAGERDAGTATTKRDLAAMEALLPADEETASDVSIAIMELGALVCTARSAGCEVCPLRERCEFASRGLKPLDGPSRKPQRYAGTNRQVRGLILNELRSSQGTIPRARIDAVWSQEAMRNEALAQLLEEGLVESDGAGNFGFPGSL